MSSPTPEFGAHAPYPPERPERAWWWLPAAERARRKKQRHQWELYRRSARKAKSARKDEPARKRDRWDDGCVDCCGDAFCDIASPCMIAIIPVMLASGVRFALTGGRGRRAADPAAPAPAGFAAGVLYGAVRYYRTEVSPRRPACCPYTPSCSTYAVQALHRHGALRGARLTAGRLLRCRPGRGGADPVPQR